MNVYVRKGDKTVTTLIQLQAITGNGLPGIFCKEMFNNQRMSSVCLNACRIISIGRKYTCLQYVVGEFYWNGI